MKKILFSLMAIVLAVGLVGAGAFAYFSDTETSEGNVFTAGTLDLKVTGGQSGSDSVIATWKSPDDWKPGDIVGDLGTSEIGRLLLYNSGSVDAMHLMLKFTSTVEEGQNPESEEAGGDIRHKIIVTEFRIGIDGEIGGWNVVTTLAGRYGDEKLPLTLYELSDDKVGGHTVKVRGSTSKGYSAGILAGGYSNFQMTFQFAPDAGNQYQGDISTLTVEVTAGQDPTWPPPGCLEIDLPPLE